VDTGSPVTLVPKQYLAFLVPATVSPRYTGYNEVASDPRDTDILHLGSICVNGLAPRGLATIILRRDEYPYGLLGLDFLQLAALHSVLKAADVREP